MRQIFNMCLCISNDMSPPKMCIGSDYSISVKQLTEHHLEFLSLKGDCTCSSESTFVRMPHCWKSHVAAQLCTLVSCSQKFLLRRSIPVNVLVSSRIYCTGPFIVRTFIIHYSSFTM